MPKPDFDGYRNDVKKAYENDPYPLGVDEHQVPDHPSSFMNMIKGRSQAISAANDERRQVLPSRVIWDGSIDRFEVFKNNVEGHYGQIGAGYLYDTDFQTVYLEKGVDCYFDFMEEVPSASHVNKDARALYGAILSAVVDQDALIKIPEGLREFSHKKVMEIAYSVVRLLNAQYEPVQTRFLDTHNALHILIVVIAS